MLNSKLKMSNCISRTGDWKLKKLLLRNQNFETKLNFLKQNAPYRLMAHQLRDRVKSLQSTLQGHQKEIFRYDIQLFRVLRENRSVSKQLHRLRNLLTLLTHNRGNILLDLDARGEVIRRISPATRMQIGASIDAAHAAMRQDDAISAEGTEEDEDAAEEEDESE